MAYLVRAGN